MDNFVSTCRNPHGQTCWTRSRGATTREPGPIAPAAIACLLLVMAGCQRSTTTVVTTPPVQQPTADSALADPNPRAVAPRPPVPQEPATSLAVPEPVATIEPSPETHPPQVLLSDAHAETCLLKVGDRMPAVTLTDIAGTQHKLEHLYGEEFTVIVFWNGQIAAALEQFQRLLDDVWAPWSQAGVAVLAINEGDSADRIRALTGDAKDKIVNLLDSDGAVFSQVATRILPRTYLVDQQGKILWFDIEYSQSTQRELRNALAYYLRQ